MTTPPPRRTAATTPPWTSSHDRAGRRAPQVGVVGGSRSDFPVLEDAVAVLLELGVLAELRVVSAHRTPDLLFRYAEDAAFRGSE